MRRGLQPSSAGLIFSKDSPPFQRSVDTPMNFKLLVMLTLLFTATCVLAGNEDDEVRKLTGSWSLSLNSNDKLAFYKLVISSDKGYGWKDKSGVEKGTLSIDQISGFPRFALRNESGRRDGQHRRPPAQADAMHQR